nr:PadR family transcriptional regulator [Weissella sagaensis]
MLSTRGGLSGYQINDIIRNQLNHFYDGGYGMIYPTLKKLEKEGMVTKEKITQDEKPNKNIFYITDAGKESFQTIVNEETEPEIFKSDFLLKLYFSDSLTEDKKRTFLEEELIRKKEKLATLESNHDEWLKNGMSNDQKFTVDYGIAYYRIAITMIEKKLAE